MTAPEMSHWERIKASLKGDEIDRIPISLWRHSPTEDETPQGLAAATLRWQKAYDFDLVKFTPTGTYGIEDWGAQTTYIPNDLGVRTIIKHGVTSADQWPHLKQLEVTQGYLGNQLIALQLVAEELRDSVPILQTIFSPLTTARKLAGDRVFADLRLHPETLRRGLQIIAETTIRFALESIRTGAHGIFFAIQCATYRALNAAEYSEFGEYYDRLVLSAVRPEAQIIVMHVHGEDVMFDLAASYSADAINWHDRITWPSLSEARDRFPGMLIGGINEWQTLLHGSPDAIQSEIRDAIGQTGGRRFMVGPGCVAPTNTPSERIRVARDAVERCASAATIKSPIQ